MAGQYNNNNNNQMPQQNVNVNPEIDDDDDDDEPFHFVSNFEERLNLNNQQQPPEGIMQNWVVGDDVQDELVEDILNRGQQNGRQNRRRPQVDIAEEAQPQQGQNGPKTFDDNIVLENLPVFHGPRYGRKSAFIQELRNELTPENMLDSNAVRNILINCVAASEMPAQRVRINGLNTQVFDGNEFTELRQQLRNDPELTMMALDLVNRAGYRNRLLGYPAEGEPYDIEKFVKNVATSYGIRKGRIAGTEPEGIGENWVLPNAGGVQVVDVDDLDAVEELQQNELQRRQQQMQQDLQQAQEDLNRNPAVAGQEINENGIPTFGQYIDAMRDMGQRDGPVDVGPVVGLIAATMLIGQKNRNDLIDINAIATVSKNIQSEASLLAMVSEDNDRVKELVQNGDGVALVEMMAAKRDELDKRNAIYRRPEGTQVNDAGFLQFAMDSVKSKTHRKKSPESEEKRNFWYKEMMSKVRHIHKLNSPSVDPETGKKVPGQIADGTVIKGLIDTTKSYINKGTNIPGGPATERKMVAAFKEAMCILRHYMPEKEFREYCNEINEAHNGRMIANPDAYLDGRLSGTVFTAAEQLKALKDSVKKNMTVDNVAEAAAIMMACEQDTSRIVLRRDVDRIKEELLKPGSAFMRTMSTEADRTKLGQLAAKGDTRGLAQMAQGLSAQHVARTSDGQVRKASRSLQDHAINMYTASKSLSAVIAAYRMIKKCYPGQNITVGGYKKEAEEVEKDPAFRGFVRKYMTDDVLRRAINDSLKGNNPKCEVAGLAFENYAKPKLNRDRQVENVEPNVQERQQEQQQANAQANPRNAAVNLALHPDQAHQQKLLTVQDQWKAANYDPAYGNGDHPVAADSHFDYDRMPKNTGLGDQDISQVRAMQQNFVRNYKQYTTKDQVKQIIASILAFSTTPVYAEGNADNYKLVVNKEAADNTFNNLYYDPKVDQIAETFMNDPAFADALTKEDSRVSYSGMVNNINRTYNNLLKAEVLERNRQMQNGGMQLQA